MKSIVRYTRLSQTVMFVGVPIANRSDVATVVKDTKSPLAYHRQGCYSLPIIPATTNNVQISLPLLIKPLL